MFGMRNRYAYLSDDSLVIRWNALR